MVGTRRNPASSSRSTFTAEVGPRDTETLPSPQPQSTNTRDTQFTEILTDAELASMSLDQLACYTQAMREKTEARKQRKELKRFYEKERKRIADGINSEDEDDSDEESSRHSKRARKDPGAVLKDLKIQTYDGRGDLVALLGWIDLIETIFLDYPTTITTDEDKFRAARRGLGTQLQG